MLRLALLSFWHVHATDYLREAEQHPDTKVVAAWDETPEPGRSNAEARGLRFTSDLEAVLADPGIDGVIVTTRTTAHRSTIIAAARAGKHIFAEKVIAPTLRESIEIVQAVAGAGVTMMVALNRSVESATLRTLELIRAGELGEITAARVRVAHDGALPTSDGLNGWLPARFYDQQESGGGAMIDLGAHPLYLTRLFLGRPESIFAMYGDFTRRGVEDNGAVVLRSASGAIGIAETSFVDRGGGFGFHVCGTAGSVTYIDGDRHLRFRRSRRETATTMDLPVETPRPFSRWVEAIQRGSSTAENLALALELSALEEAAYRSAKSGQAMRIEELDGWAEYGALVNRLR